MALHSTDAHFEATIQFLATAEGGRETPVASGYRGQFHHLGGEDVADVEWSFCDKDMLVPGEAGRCSARFYSPNRHLSKLHVGDSFEVREGARVVARGIIKSMLDTDLQSIK